MTARPLSVLAAIYVLLFAALGAEVSFLPHVLAANGLSARQVGLVLSVGIFTQVLAGPVAGKLADRSSARLVLILAALLATATLLLLLALAGHIVSAMLAYVLFAMATAPLNPLADAIAIPACEQANVSYGRVRGVGSVGFLAGILLSSALAGRLGINSTILTAAALFVGLAIVLPFVPTAAKPVDARHAEGAIGTLLRIKPYRRVLLVAAMVIGSHAMSDAFAVIYWQANGIRMGTVGILLGVAVVSELVAFTTIGPALVERFGASATAACGALFGCLGWVVLAQSSRVWLMALTQVLHGLAFPLVHLACMHVLADIAPRRFFATAQSLYGICSNAIASAIVTFAAGALFADLGGHAFLLAAGLCLFALPLTVRLSAGAVRAGSANA